MRSAISHRAVSFHENRHRYYDPYTGTYLQVDPKVEDTWEAYNYVEQNPVMFTDPRGDRVRLPSLGFSRPGAILIETGSGWNNVFVDAAGCEHSYDDPGSWDLNGRWHEVTKAFQDLWAEGGLSDALSNDPCASESSVRTYDVTPPTYMPTPLDRFCDEHPDDPKCVFFPAGRSGDGWNPDDEGGDRNNEQVPATRARPNERVPATRGWPRNLLNRNGSAPERASTEVWIGSPFPKPGARNPMGGRIVHH